MKLIGLIGGMTWESTVEYYRIMNESVKGKLGESHSVRCLLYSFDFAPIAKLQEKRKWKELTKLMVSAAQTLEKSGAELMVICANTMHIIADEVQNAISIPIINIIDVVAEEILKNGLSRVGLLGTKYTMEEDFYKKRLREKYVIEVTIPDEVGRNVINNVIYRELSLGITKNSSKEKFIEIISSLLSKNAEGIILGCTEIPLLINKEEVNAPVFDTTSIHAKAAVRYALK